MNDVAEAVRLLRAGKLVAFPTETVYGLGADATSVSAVRGIFVAKGRPPTNPLIAHVSNEAMAQRYAAHWPPSAQLLARQFWPGPLTLVVSKAPPIVDEATAGRPTVGLRAPDHPLALQLLREFDGAICAPSANRSTRISPTSAQHVRDDLGDAVDLILDGGPCRVGIESTVLDLSGSAPAILRLGAITREQIERIIGPVSVFQGSIGMSNAALSPGQQEIHYAPKTPAFRYEGRSLDSPVPTGRIAAIVLADSHFSGAHWHLQMPQSSEEYARRLYSALREADQSGAEVILIQMPPNEPQWAAVRDRLIRATRPI
ncbi:MAG TPA: L-threonylcarbamoyladenylate synthase [Humisphaera sp.]|jgi:L-threonylcarbamoyladenylate synthase|nr:L-threonylcarbamoyladenylate synthase [Humisphaera sp.]